MNDTDRPTRTAGSINVGDRVIDPNDGQPRDVIRTVGGAPYVALFLRGDPGQLDRMHVYTLTDRVQLAN